MSHRRALCSRSRHFDDAKTGVDMKSMTVFKSSNNTKLEHKAKPEDFYAQLMIKHQKALNNH